ncbi:MAG: nucleotidyltransferase domain-containing protein [archaeon]
MRLNNREKILEVFYEFPEKVFTVREVAKISGVARATAHNILIELKKEGMIDKDGRASWGRMFLTKKVNYYVEKIVDSGLVDFLIEKLVPSAIILFGSVGKGDSVKESDVDIFVESAIDNADEFIMNLDLKKFEKKIGHKVELFIEGKILDLKKRNPHLFNNVVNGVKLYGVFDIK